MGSMTIYNQLRTGLIRLGVGVLGLGGALALGQQASTNLNASTSVTINKYVNVTFSSASSALDITVSDGGQTGTYNSGTATFIARSNCPFSISHDISGYTGAGSLSVVNFSFSNPAAATAGTTGTIQVRLTGVSLNSPPQANTSATVTITVTAL